MQYLTQTIQQAAWNATPPPNTPLYKNSCAQPIKQKIIDKRKLHKRWKTTRLPRNKAALNKAIKELKQLLYQEKQQAITIYLKSLTATEATDYSLWKAIKRLKNLQVHVPPIRTNKGEWAKSNIQKADLFAEYFKTVFMPYPSDILGNDDWEVLTSPVLPGLPPTPLKILQKRKSKLLSMNCDPINPLDLTSSPAQYLNSYQTSDC
jgi:hypothetical protein